MDLGAMSLLAALLHQDFARPQETHPRGHPLDRPAAGFQVGPGRQHQQAGTQAHQHVHPQAVRLGPGGGMGPVEAHGQAAEHGQAHAHQGLEVGGELQGHIPPWSAKAGPAANPSVL